MTALALAPGAVRTAGRRPTVGRRTPLYRSATSPLAFGLFLLLTAILLIRPTEIVPSLDGLPLFQAVILVCLMAAGPAVLSQFGLRNLAARPITACVLVMALVVPLSNLRDPTAAISTGFDFLKVIAYYLVLVSVVDTPRRLRGMVLWLVGCLVAHTVLALMNFHGFMEIPAMKPHVENVIEPETGRYIGTLPRICGVGYFGNPNDLSRILVVGATLCFYLMRELPRVLIPALAGLAGMFIFALTLTYSRGGLLALIATALTLLQVQFGGRRTAVAAVGGLAVLQLVAGGRQTDMSTDEGTGQQRIQLWMEGFEALLQSPVFGIGVDRYPEVTGGLAAHNSFVQAYVEMGFIGGTAFLAAVVLALWGTYRLGPRRAPELSETLVRVRPFTIAVVAGYAVGMLSSTRTYVTPTFMLLGLAAVYQQLAACAAPRLAPRMSLRLVGRMAAASAVTLTALYLFGRLSVRWSS